MTCVPPTHINVLHRQSAHLSSRLCSQIAFSIEAAELHDRVLFGASRESDSIYSGLPQPGSIHTGPDPGSIYSGSTESLGPLALSLTESHTSSHGGTLGAEDPEAEHLRAAIVYSEQVRRAIRRRLRFVHAQATHSTLHDLHSSFTQSFENSFAQSFTAPHRAGSHGAARARAAEKTEAFARLGEAIDEVAPLVKESQYLELCNAAKAVFDAWGRTSGPGSSLIAEDLQADEQLHPLDSLGRPLPMPPWGESEYGYGTEFGYGTYDA